MTVMPDPTAHCHSISVEFAPALRVADMEPVTGSVAGTLKSRRVDEGFQQHRSEAVALLPVAGQALGHHRQGLRCQVAAVDPWQDQESGLTDDPVQTPPALLVSPADEVVPRRHLPCRCSEPHRAQNALPVHDEVTYLAPGSIL